MKFYVLYVIQLARFPNAFGDFSCADLTIDSEVHQEGSVSEEAVKAKLITYNLLLMKMLRERKLKHRFQESLD